MRIKTTMPRKTKKYKEKYPTSETLNLLMYADSSNCKKEKEKDAKKVILYNCNHLLRINLVKTKEKNIYIYFT